MSLYDRIQAHKRGGTKSLAERIQEHKATQQPEKKSPGIASYLKEPLIATLNLGQTIGKYTNPAEYIWPQPDIDWREATGGVPEEERTFGHKAAGFVPELAASLLAPEVAVPSAIAKGAAAIKGGKYALKAAQNALPQAGIAAAFNPESAQESAGAAGATTVPFSIFSQLLSEGNPLLRKAGKIGLAGGAGLLAHQAAKSGTENEYIASPLSLAAAGLAYRPSLKTLARKIQENRVNPKLENKLMKSGERLGIDVAPHEANPTYPMGVIKGGIGKSAEGATLAVEKGNQRLAQEEKAIEKLFTSMTPKEQTLAKKSLYKEAYATPVPKEIVAPFKQNENVKRAIKSVEKEPEFVEEFKSIKSKDSLEYWDLVKRALDTRIEKAGTKNDGNLNTIGRLATKSKNALVAELDKVVPEYKQARNFAQKEIVTDDLKHFFNKRKLTATNLTKALDNKMEFRNLLKVFKDKPEVRQQLIDWKRLSQHLHSNIPNAKAGAKLEATNLNKERSSLQKVGDYFNKTLNKKYDKAAVELMANPKWRDEVHKLSQVTNNEKRAAKFMELLGKAGAQEAAQSR